MPSNTIEGLLDEMFEQLTKAQSLAKRTADAMERGAFRTDRQHPSALRKEEVVVNPPAFQRVDEQICSFQREHPERAWIIAREMFEFISMPDGRLLVVYPMFGTAGSLDLDAEIADMRWVGDVVGGVVEAEDWFPVTVIGNLNIVTVAGGGIDE
jgi:hypothetical protein